MSLPYPFIFKLLLSTSDSAFTVSDPLNDLTHLLPAIVLQMHCPIRTHCGYKLQA